MARKFLYVIAAIVFLIVIAFSAFRLFPQQIMQAAFVPSAEFVPLRPATPNIYNDPGMWYARPEIATDNPALWTPPGAEPTRDPKAAAFFIHPTSYLSREGWNAPLDDPDATRRAKLFLRSQASVFNGIAEVWAPKYRQATLGAFLTDDAAGERALDAAYADVVKAFDAFVAAQPADRPLILAGHSQGSMHLSRLLKDKVAGKPIADRVVAAYVVGWPVPLTADLPAMGLPACERADQTRCILSWQSFAEPAGYEDTMALFEARPSLTGKSRVGDRYLCTNPVTGTTGSTSAAADSMGMLKPAADLKSAELVAAGAPARCDDKGFLLIGEGPDLGPYVLPNNNYHVYDYPLFWANTRADAARRVAAFRAR